MDSLLHDLRYALRVAVRAPGFTAVAVLALAIGMGANTAIFTIVNAALIERLPFKDPDRLVVLWEENARRPMRPNTVGPANYLRWRERASSFEDLAGFVDTRTNLTGSGQPEELIVQNVTDAFLPLLGVTPVLGRTFTAAESTDPKANVAILSYGLWQRRFGGDREIIGRAIQLNGAPTTVVGIMPADVRLTTRNSLAGKPIDLWRPWVLPPEFREPRGRFMSVLGRLKPGAPLTQAQAEMKTIAAGLETEIGRFDTGWSVMVVPIREELAGNLRPALLMLMGAVAFVLLIACANVANLLLARAAVRQREMAIRGALGAGRARMMRQLLTESLVLAFLGGAAGLLVAEWGVDALVAISPVDLTNVGPIHISYPVLLFTALISMATAVIAGLAPAFASVRTDIQESLKESARQVGGRHTLLRASFVVAEVALAVVLLVGAGLMLRSFTSLRAIAPGYDTHNVLTMRVSLPTRTYDDVKSLRFYAELSERVRSLPGVEAAGSVSFLPLTGLGAATDFAIVGEPPTAPGKEYVVDVRVCDNGYFAAMRIPLLRGRWFTDREMREKSNVVIVNEEMARRHFAGEDPLGKQLVISMTNPNVPTTIIGVVGNAVMSDVRAETRPQSYWPPPQLPYAAMSLTVRTSSDPLSFASVVQREVQGIDKDQPVSDVRTMDQWLTRSLAQDRFDSLLLTVFAAVALLLASIGIYGVMSYSVSQRTSEIGVRLVLGAERSDILRLVVGNGIRLAAIGLAIGVALALALSRSLTGLLYDTSGTDPVTFVAVVLLLATVATIASYIPARRASRIPPVEALRYK